MEHPAEDAFGVCTSSCGNSGVDDVDSPSGTADIEADGTSDVACGSEGIAVDFELSEAVELFRRAAGDFDLAEKTLKAFGENFLNFSALDASILNKFKIKFF